MNRSRMTRVVAASCLVVGALFAFSGGCVEAEGRFYADRFCPAPNEDGTFECDDKFISGFEISAECLGESCFAAGAIGFLRVSNAMPSSLALKQNYNDVETSTILLTGYDVRVNTGSEETEYAYNVSGFVAPDGGETIFGVQLIPLGSEAADLLGTVGPDGAAGWAGIRVYGRTTGGLDVETPETFVPLNFL